MATNLFRRLALAAFSAILVLTVVSVTPANAQGASPCPAGQPPGRPPGTPPGPPQTPSRPPEGRPSQYTSRSECALRLSQSSASAGERVTLAGSGYAPGSKVELTLNSDPIALGAATADGSGAFRHQITVPAAAPIGSHTITAAGVDRAGASFVLSAAFEVTGGRSAARASAAGPELPRTGSTTGPMVAASGFLLLVGAALVLTAKRNRSQVEA